MFAIRADKARKEVSLLHILFWARSRYLLIKSCHDNKRLKIQRHSETQMDVSLKATLTGGTRPSFHNAWGKKDSEGTNELNER